MSLVAKIGLFLGILILGLVGVVIYAQTQVTPDKVRSMLVPLVEDTLHRQVAFGDIQIGFFSGISVADLRVKKQNSKEDFITIKNAKLSYRFLPLLRGRVVVDQVMFDEPVIDVSRFTDGSYNFSDLLGKNRSDRGQYPQAARALVSDIFSLFVHEVSVKNGSLTYTDKFKSPNVPYRFALQNLNIHAREIAPDKAFPLDLSVVLNGARLDLSGHYDITHTSGDFLVHLADLDMIPFSPYYRDLLPGKVGSGRVSLNLEVDLQTEQLSSKGKLTLADLDLTLPNGTSLQKVHLTTDYALTFDFTRKQLDLSTLLVDLNDLGVGMEGRLDFATKETKMDLAVIFDQLDLRQVMQSLPDQLIRNYRKYSIAGSISGRAQLVGTLGQGSGLLKSAQLTLNGVQASVKDMRGGVSGALSYADAVVTAQNLVLSYGNQQALLNLQATRQPGGLLQGTFSLSAEELNLNELVAAGSSVSSEEEGNPSSAGGLGPFALPLDLHGDLTVRKALFKQLVVEQVTADVSLSDNRLRLDRLRGEVGQGRVLADAVVDLGVRGLLYQGQLDLTDVDAAVLAAGLLPDLGATLTGRLQWRSSFWGGGASTQPWLDRLQSKGELSLQQGLIKGFPVVDSLAVFLGVDELHNLKFEDFSAGYDLRDGLVRVNGLLTGSQARLAPLGSIDNDGRLNMNLEVRLAPDLAGRMGASGPFMKVFSDERGWGIIPVRLLGSLAHPELGPDTTAIEKLMMNRVSQDTAREAEEDNSSPSDQESVKKMLDKTLNKLFGK